MRRAPLALASLALVATLVAGCGDDDPVADDGSTTTIADDATTTTATVDPTSTTLTPFPSARAGVAHGDQVWGVVLAGATGSDDDAPALAAAVDAAEAAGYDAGPADAGCDMGSAEALGLDPMDGAVTVSVLFDTEAQARQALRAFEERGFDGAAVAQLTLYCLD